MKSNVKLYADETSLFSVVRDKNESSNILNKNLLSVSKWACNWKMLFNPDPSRPDQEVLFSRKKKVQIHPTISLSNNQNESASYQKHLGILLDEQLNFKQHIASAILKINKGISVKKNFDIVCLENP